MNGKERIREERRRWIVILAKKSKKCVNQRELFNPSFHHKINNFIEYLISWMNFFAGCKQKKLIQEMTMIIQENYLLNIN